MTALLTVVAAVCAAASLALLVPAPPGRLAPRGLAGLEPTMVVALSMAALCLLLLVLPLRPLVPALIGAAGSGIGRLLWVRRRERRDADATSRRVLETCEQLASELATGQPPGAALLRAAEDWSELAPVAEAFKVGSDVPGALRALAERPGAGDLRLLAAAWQVAHRTGQGLADAVDRVARQLLDTRATRRVVDGELSSARATARLVAALPLAALAMGSGVGGDPVGFLLRTPAGWLCLAVGLGFALAGLWWIEALARGVDRSW